MLEQTAVLMKDQDEGLLVTDDDELERVWQDFDAAMEELRLEDIDKAAAKPADQDSMQRQLNRRIPRRQPFPVRRRPAASALVPCRAALGDRPDPEQILGS